MNELKGDLPEGFKMTELGPLPGGVGSGEAGGCC